MQPVRRSWAGSSRHEGADLAAFELLPAPGMASCSSSQDPVREVRGASRLGSLGTTGKRLHALVRGVVPDAGGPDAGPGGEPADADHGHAALEDSEGLRRSGKDESGHVGGLGGGRR